MTEVSKIRGTNTFVSIQYLRAVAAVIVVYYHIFSNRVAEQWATGRDFGLSGVDIFFVISGFIMWMSTSHHRSGVRNFLRRRIYRIYPMWWIALTVWISMRFVVPDRLHNADVTVPTVICSYLLVPHFHQVFSGQIWPILVPGWSLQLEIFFYAIFAATLLIGNQAMRLAVIVTMLCALAIAGSLFMPGGALLRDYTSPLLIEFAAGILLAALFGNSRRLPNILGALLICVGLFWLVINYRLIAQDGITRILTLGIPAALIVAGALVLEPLLARRPNALILLFGDASYSLYLTHPIAIAVAAVVWERLHLPVGSDTAALAFIPFALAGALVLSVMTFRYVEKPLLRILVEQRSSRAAALVAMVTEPS